MSEECFDILIYVPLKKEDLSENEMKWIDTFQWILSLGFKQITKHKITLSLHFANELPKVKDLMQNKNSVVQILVSTKFQENSLIDDVAAKGSKVIQVICDPKIKDFLNDKGTVINLFDETKNKGINLVDEIHQLKNEIWLKFLDIAYEIRRICDHSKVSEKTKGKIYVAQTSTDQNHNRETIVRELEHLGFEVLPKATFPKNMLQFSDLVHSNLRQCFISVHLIGNYYAPLLESIDVSGIELQNDIFHEVAAELKRENKTIKRFVWIAPDFKPKSEKQKLYVESFKRNIELLKNTEIIQTPIEIFKNIVRTKIVDILSPKQQLTADSVKNKEKQVYLITNDQGNDNYNAIKSQLQKNKIQVLESTNKENKIDLIKEHYFNLINCDALFIDYSVDNNQWLNSKLSDVLKSPGFGRKKDFEVKTVLINTPVTPAIHLQISDLDLLNGDGDISKRINFFIEKLI